MNNSANLCLTVILIFLLNNLQAQKNFIEYKGDKYERDDSAEVYIFYRNNNLRFSKGFFYEKSDRKNMRAIKPDTILYIPCYLKEYRHSHAAYVYTDDKGTIVAHESIKVSGSGKNYVYTYKHRHVITFLRDSINGVPVKNKRFRFFELKEVWAPPSYG